MFIINKIKKNYFLLLCTFLFFYIIFNLLDGERGLISYFDKNNRLENLLKKQKNINVKLNKTEHKISLLTENIDLDFIEILIRDKFFYGKKNEKVYLLN
jgi:cell division protein FtsB|tara:strand:+ start:2848 stop:3144 length:297 start_codon:yes stop_codon:yes gene_type:complete